MDNQTYKVLDGVNEKREALLILKNAEGKLPPMVINIAEERRRAGI